MGDSRVTELARVLARPSAVIFVGSGISTWAGLPSWAKLLSSLLARADQIVGKPLGTAHAYFNKGQFLETADAIKMVLEPNDICEVLRQELGFETAVPARIHELITSFATDCFVTTNFDSLIENQITIKTGTRPRVVTNLDRIDMPAVFGADSRRFVFRPHGDIDRAESIVLSRSQYLSGIRGEGSQSAALHALGTILASRPVVFVGYSLNDVDFQVMMQSVRETFAGPAMPHWAIMPDLPENDAAFLHESFGIRVISYPVRKDAGGVIDHSELIQLLEVLHNEARNHASSATASRQSLPLEIARYGARLAQLEEGASLKISTGVRESALTADFIFSEYGSLRECLETIQDPFLVIGPAGSGKSHTLRNYIAGLGQQLRDWGLGNSHGAVPRVPVLLDSKLYTGSFNSLFELSVPAELAPECLPSGTPVDIILDSLDEMPAEHLESGDWLVDFNAFSERFESARVIIASRRGYGAALGVFYTLRHRN